MLSEDATPAMRDGNMPIEPMRKRSDFLAARRGRRLNGPFFFLEVLDRQDGAVPRLGLTVTRKVGNAVVRNRIRRRLREAIRTACWADMQTGFDYVIVARREAFDLPFARLVDELSQRLRGRQGLQRAVGGAMAGASRRDTPRSDKKKPPRGSVGNG